MLAARSEKYRLRTRLNSAFVRIAVGSDHAGFELKEFVRKEIAGMGHEVVDLGTHSSEPCDYPDFSEAVAKAVVDGKAERGVLVCGSGVGAAMAANKVPGARAGNVMDTYSAHQGVEHDDVNILVLGARVIGIELAREVLKAFLNAHFTQEERHVRRLSKVKAIEARYCPPAAGKPMDKE
jgi:RpiB/LacA/LacB family sugar-phosphate isomerase